MEKIADISELCRVCLDSARELVPFDKKLYYTQYSIIDLIHFCTGVVYNDSEEENILPKHLCIPCLEKIQTAYELKTKCVESDKYLSSILGSTVSHQELPEILIDEPFMPSIEVLPYYEESMANTGENDSSDDYSNATYLMKELISGHSKTNKRVLPRNLKSGKSSTCNICQKVFKYSKSYNRHMERHEEESNPEETYKIQVSDHSDDISYDDTAEASYQAHSRSPSIEIIPEIDAIAEVYKITPDSDDNQNVAVISSIREFATNSVTKHRCNICGQSFALKVYLSKHKRRQHPGSMMIQD